MATKAVVFVVVVVVVVRTVRITRVSVHTLKRHATNLNGLAPLHQSLRLD